MQKQDINEVILQGNVLEEPHISHCVKDEAFFALPLGVVRRSGMVDQIPVVLPARMVSQNDYCVGDALRIHGQVRTYSRMQGEARKLLVTVFARDILCQNPCEGEGQNHVVLEGFLCKPPVYRMTPLGREIADLLLAVNRAFHRTDYIPCIAWGWAARFASTLCVGQAVRVEGRFQSRGYTKRLEDGCEESRTAYEISVLRIEKQADKE